MYRKQNIFFDFDNMQFDTHQQMLRAITELFKIPVVLEDFHNNPWMIDIVRKYNPDFCDNKHPHEFEKSFADFFLDSKEKHEDVMPFPDMPEVVANLTDYYNLWGDTARPKSSLPVILSLYDIHVPGCMKGVNCVYWYNEIK